jgi:hypothetical protein
LECIVRVKAAHFRATVVAWESVIYRGQRNSDDTHDNRTAMAYSIAAYVPVAVQNVGTPHAAEIVSLACLDITRNAANDIANCCKR